MDFMKGKSSFLASSLILGAVATLTTTPAQAFIINSILTYDRDIIGFKQTFTDNLGRDLTGISLSSPSFSLNSFSGNGTNSVSASYFGGFVPAGTPFSLTTNIGDQSDNNSINVSVAGEAYVIANGVPTALSSFSSGLSCITSGDGTPYLAVLRALTAFPATLTATSGVSSISGTFQCQGDALQVNNQTGSNFTVEYSTKSISGYQDPGSLGTFPPFQTITINPGLNIIPVTESVSVPEPTSTLGILAFGSLFTTGFVFKRLVKR